MSFLGDGELRCSLLLKGGHQQLRLELRPKGPLLLRPSTFDLEKFDNRVHQAFLEGRIFSIYLEHQLFSRFWPGKRMSSPETL